MINCLCFVPGRVREQPVSPLLGRVRLGQEPSNGECTYIIAERGRPSSVARTSCATFAGVALELRRSLAVSCQKIGVRPGPHCARCRA